MHTLKIGDTIMFDEQEYILYFVNSGCDLEGRTIRLEGMDPIRAQKHIEEQRSRREALIAQAGMVRLMPKLEKQLDD